jgi:pyruvate,orthophosphate dikinase
MTTTSTSCLVVLDGTSELGKADLGGKAWGVNRMRRLGLPVPPAFVVPTWVCRDYLRDGTLPAGVTSALQEGISALEEATGRGFGDPTRPLLVSVRSGAAESMPGMMDTILNLGMDDFVAEALSHQTDAAAWVAETRTTFQDQYAHAMQGLPVSDEPWQQLQDAVEAVFRSWQSARAQAYRTHHGLAHDAGTAVTVQAMVFGNADDTSGTGVLFTRNPLDGMPSAYGEWLPRAQGDDVVSGRRTPFPLARLAVDLPDVHAELLRAAATLEGDGRDIQDIEFTVESGRLYVLQTRAAKRAPRAAVRIAVALVAEGVLTPDEALRSVAPAQVRSLGNPGLSEQARAAAVLLATGLPACPGLASGLVVTDPDDAITQSETEAVVLVRPTTSPDDVHGMLVASAVVTEHGGTTSHAALVSRELGLPCVVGCGDGLTAALAGRTVTVDGATGQIFDGVLISEAADESSDPDLKLLREWAVARTSITVHRTADVAPPGAVDVNALDDEAIQDLLATGVTDVVADPQLPFLLAAVRAGT